MTKLAYPHSFMKRQYDVVVIGSGYGASIAASRMARAGKGVCLLERGKEFQAGEFPDTTLEAVSEVQVDTPDGHVGARTGMFDFRINKEMSALVGCGLGGTSLINANVSIRPEDRVFDQPCWPQGLRDDVPTRLAEGYRRAEEMLRPTPYPDTFPTLAKMEALKKSAAYLNKPYQKLPINVTFEDGTNPVGVDQKACNLCGDCVSGCNHTSKNTTQMNYLPDAKKHGAEIYTQASVKYILRDGEQWSVYYELLNEKGENERGDVLVVRAAMVILGAGTLGSSEILLRSKEKGLEVSDTLGRHFSGNGDVLGFTINCPDQINGIGFGNKAPETQENVGPCITGVIDMRHQQKLDDGMIIEEGSIPGALSKLLPVAFKFAADVVGEVDQQNPEVAATLEQPINPRGDVLTPTLATSVRERLHSVERIFDDKYHGVTGHTQTYLVMSHDDSDGTLMLEQDRVRIHWPKVGEKEIFSTINHQLLKTTEGIGGQYLRNPLWTDFTHYDLITVHPLGGCAMGESAETGVVNHKGQVFAGKYGEEVHEGLYVCDGAVIPRSLGVNPLLTISAIAERTCAYIADDYKLEINYELGQFQPKKLDEQEPGVAFTETMRGAFTEKATGKESKLEFTLTIEFENLEKALTQSAHLAKISHGTVTTRALSQASLVVEEGEFNLFTSDKDQVETKNMVYRMKLKSQEHKTYYFEGRKYIHHDAGFDLWSDTTTLFYRLFDGDCDEGELLGEGVLHIEAMDFLKQLTTIHVTHARTSIERLQNVARFGSFFFGELYDVYGGIFAKETLFNPDAPPRKKRPLRTSAAELHRVKTADGVNLRLLRYRGGTKGPVILGHGVGQNSLMYSLDTVDTNMLEYLFANGYDVWLLDWRGSVALEASHQLFTGDEVATYDYPAVVETVRAVTQAKDVQFIVHCVASITLHMSMLQGLQGVRSIIAMQIGTHMNLPLLGKVKVGLHVPNLLDAVGVKSLTAYVDTHRDWKDKVIDAVLKLYPTADEDECHNAVCHRTNFLYGVVFNHKQLNDLSHNTIHEYFGNTNIHMFEHLALIGRKGKLVSADGEDIYMPHLDRLALPITYIHGGVNKVFLPDSTEKTFHLLRKHNGDHFYHRYEIEEYGHCDCVIGKNAAKDVYPLVLKHLDEHNEVT